MSDGWCSQITKAFLYPYNFSQCKFYAFSWLEWILPSFSQISFSILVPQNLSYTFFKAFIPHHLISQPNILINLLKSLTNWATLFLSISFNISQQLRPFPFENWCRTGYIIVILANCLINYQRINWKVKIELTMSIRSDF